MWFWRKMLIFYPFWQMKKIDIMNLIAFFDVKNINYFL